MTVLVLLWGNYDGKWSITLKEPKKEDLRWNCGKINFALFEEFKENKSKTKSLNQFPGEKVAQKNK